MTVYHETQEVLQDRILCGINRLYLTTYSLNKLGQQMTESLAAIHKELDALIFGQDMDLERMADILAGVEANLRDYLQEVGKLAASAQYTAECEMKGG